MKKILKVLLLLGFTLYLTSCSSDDNNINTVEPVNLLKINDINVPVTIARAIKTDNLINIEVTGAFGSIYFYINPSGKMYDATGEINSANEGVIFENFENNPSIEFDFNLLEFDPITKKIKGKFTGKLYSDRNDLNSESSKWDGFFNITYVENVIPGNSSNLLTTAKIGTLDWVGTSFSYSPNNFQNTYGLKIKSNDAHFMNIVIPFYNRIIGNYTFNSSSQVYKVFFYKYDSTLNELVEYSTSGNINFTDINSYFVQGTFNFIATHPTNGTTINVTNGVFKESVE